MDRYHRSVSDTNLLLSFANTARDPETDLLSTRDEAAAWLAAADLLPAESRLSGSDHSALLRLRDSLRDVLAAHTGGREDADAAARLTRALADGRLVLTVDPASTIGLASAARASSPMRVLSPRIEPPDRVEVGSTASTATRRPCSTRFMPS